MAVIELWTAAEIRCPICTARAVSTVSGVREWLTRHVIADHQAQHQPTGPLVAGGWPQPVATIHATLVGWMELSPYG